jgi:hypothetical protein
MDTERQTTTAIMSWLSGGILIALVTATAYLWAFSYETGFCNYFRITFYLISLSLTTILPVAGSIILITSFMVFIFITPGIILSPLFRYTTKSITGLIISALAVLLLSFVHFLVFTGWQRNGWILLEIYIVFLMMIIFLRPLFTQRGKGSYKEKLAAELQQYQEPRSSRPQTNPNNLAFVVVLIVFVFVCIGIYGAYDMGSTNAQERRLFLVLPKSSEVPVEVVVLTAYGDYIITSPIDRSTKTIEKTLYLLKLSEISKIPLTFENVGPLKIKESSKAVP